MWPVALKGDWLLLFKTPVMLPAYSAATGGRLLSWQNILRTWFLINVKEVRNFDKMA
jgi:hypothetical protein